MLFYPIMIQKKGLSFSPDPVVDWMLSKKVIMLLPALPLSVWQDILPQELDDYDWEMDKKRLKKRIIKRLGKSRIPLTFEISTIDNTFFDERAAYYKTLLTNKAISKLFLSKIKNRQFSEDQIRSLAVEMKVTEKEVVALAQQAVHQGYAKWSSAIIKKGTQWVCLRCGETELESWPGIFGTSFTCPSCLTMGAFSSQKAVLRWEEAGTTDQLSLQNSRDKSIKKPYKLRPELPFELTKAQKKAVSELTEKEQRMKTGEIKETLVWAACGAGKTEVVMGIIAQALAEEEKVLYTAPRRDVVHDIAQRSRQAYSDLDIQVLSGDLPHSFQHTGFVAATTHQVHNYYQAFDLIILDEMDAFPYHGSRVLEYALRQAMKPKARVIYLTATPSSELRKKVRNNQVFLVRLPARHHGKPLPVPELLKCKALNIGENIMIEQIIAELERLQALGPVIIFVPIIELVLEIINQMQSTFKGFKLGGSWSSDPLRKAKVQSFLQGEYDFFISTSIIERGMTLNGVQVMVLFADHPLFDERSLVQMAGRAGRTSARPDGRVVFAAATITKAMKEAIKWIEEQNCIAKREGLIE